MPTMRLRLEPTYHKQGFFNVPVDYERFVALDDGPIEIYLENSGDPIEGRIDRKANRNGTPRIHGRKALREYFQHLRVGSTLNVKFDTSTSIHISAR